MLLSLQGITHQVHTGVGVVFPADPSSSGRGERVVRSFSETTKVTFATLDEGEMKARSARGTRTIYITESEQYHALVTQCHTRSCL